MLKSFSDSIIGFIWNNYTCLPQKDRCPRWFQGCPAWGFLFHGFCWTSAIWFILSPLETISPIQIWKYERFCNLKSIPMFPVWSHGLAQVYNSTLFLAIPHCVMVWIRGAWIVWGVFFICDLLASERNGQNALPDSWPYWYPQLCMPLFMYPHSW